MIRMQLAEKSRYVLRQYRALSFFHLGKTSWASGLMLEEPLRDIIARIKRKEYCQYHLARMLFSDI